MTATTSGELGTQRMVTSLAATTPLRPAAVGRAEPDRGVDRPATARRDGHVVTRLDEVPRHGQPHRAQADEPELHVQPPEPRVRCGRYHRPFVSERVRNFSPWAYWMLHLEQLAARDPCPVDDPHAIAPWRERCRARLATLLGPMPERVPLDLEVRESVARGSYTRHSIVFDSEATMSVPAFLLVPNDRAEPGPAVLAQHGHGPGKSEVCGLDGDENETAIEHHRATTRIASPSSGMWCWRPTSATSANGPIGCRPTSTGAISTSCTRSPPAPTRSRRTSGTSPAGSTCWNSIRWSIPIASGWSASPTAARRRSSSRRGTNGSAPRW